MAKQQDVIAMLGVRTKKGKNADGPVKPMGNKRPKMKALDKKGLGVSPAPKTPSKNNTVGSIISNFQSSAYNR